MDSLIGTRLKRKRLELGLTQAQVADQLFVTRQTVAYWENNKHLPSLSVLQELASFYNVNPSYFLGEDFSATRHFNVFALIGSIFTTLLLAPTLFLITLAGLAFAWMMTGFFLIAPFMILLESQTGVHPFTWWRVNLSLGLFVGGLVATPLLWLLSKQVLHLTVTYLKHSINAISYQVIRPVEPKH
jgi:transcriptional regulator with XRE-family HTH domain